MAIGDFFVRDKKPEVIQGKNSVEEPVSVREKDADLIDSLLNGKEIVKELDTPYGVFEIKYPNGSDKLRIAHRRAEYLGGFPDSSFDDINRYQFSMWAFLDVLIVKKPERFKDMKSWADCPDQKVSAELYERGSLFCKDIREKIHQPWSRRDEKQSQAGDEGAAVDH